PNDLGFSFLANLIVKHFNFCAVQLDTGLDIEAIAVVVGLIPLKFKPRSFKNTLGRLRLCGGNATAIENIAHPRPDFTGITITENPAFVTQILNFYHFLDAVFRQGLWPRRTLELFEDIGFRNGWHRIELAEGIAVEIIGNHQRRHLSSRTVLAAAIFNKATTGKRCSKSQ